MTFPHQSAMANKLLTLLPSHDYFEIAPALERVVLSQGEIIAQSGQPIDYVYFLSTGIGSVVARSPSGQRAEAGVFGYDGYIPTAAVTDSGVSSHDVVIQLDAEGYRVEYRAFREKFEASRNLSRIMLRSIEAFSIQLAYTALSNAVHDVNERLARWLLMCHDRVAGNDIALTHEFISMMLSVRRPSVTTALHVLEGHGLISSQRGNISIRNRTALEYFARDAYGKPEKEYVRLMTGLFPASAQMKEVGASP